MRFFVLFLSLLAFTTVDTHARGGSCGSNPDRPSIGLVLSGGGARGAAHVGVIKVLEELKIPVDCVAGTSMGAIVGGLYASGLSATELEDVLYGIDWADALRDSPSRRNRSFRRKQDDVDFLFMLVEHDSEILINGNRGMFLESLGRPHRIDVTESNDVLLS